MNKNGMVLVFAVVGTVLILILPLQQIWSVQLSLLEAVAVVTSAWSVGLLARNNPLGWWIGLVGVVTYTIAILNDFLYISILMNFGKIKFMFLSKKLEQKFDNLKRPA